MKVSRSKEETEERIFWAASTYPSEDYKADEKDDASKPINKIHASSELFREQMLQIAQHSYVRTASRSWASNLRLLEARRNHGSLKNSSLSPKAEAISFEYKLGDLALRDKYDTTQTHYAAVSYCWDRSGTSWFSERNISGTSIFENGNIKAYTSSDVVYRAMQFARHHGCKHIWMDQYCIDQDDHHDKQDGIQAMDLVYQLSKYPVAILESYVDSQSRIDALGSLFTGEMDETSCLNDLEDVLKLLFDDLWFTRAWTLQEAVASGLTMYMLIGCDHALTKPEGFGCIPGEIQITIWDLQTAMVAARNWMEELLATDILEDDAIAIRISNYADELLNMLPSILPSTTSWNSPSRDSSDRQICNTAEAINILQGRQNSIFSDRLGIIGNLCDYEIRLPDGLLEPTTPYGFSTCVHTLAILNGDTSLLGHYSDPYSRSYLARDGRNAIGFTSDPSDSAAATFGFSWGPSPWGALRNIEYFDTHDEPLKLEPATLSMHGLRVKGALWCLQSCIELSQMQASFRDRWGAELRIQKENPDADIRDGDARSMTLAVDFTSTLLQKLYERGRSALARTLWSYFGPRQEDSRKSPPLYTFDEVFGPGPVLGGVADIKPELYQRGRGTLHPPIIPDARPNLLRVMLDEVCSQGSLLFGGLQTSGSSEPRVFFEECKVGDLVFTPQTALGDSVCTETIYAGQAVSWRVLPTGQMDGERCIVRCLGRRRGIYRMDDLETREFCLE